jgi:hypothetical protein
MPQKLDPQVLTSILDAMTLKPFTGLKTAAGAYSISPTTVFRWQAESAAQEKEGRKDSDFEIEWMCIVAFWHRHVHLARRLSIQKIDQRLRDLAINGTREYLFKQQGEPVWEVDPKLAADALDPDLWQLVHGTRDRKDIFKRDENGALIQAYKEVPPNPQLLIKACAALLPQIYGETIRHQVEVGGVLRVGTTSAAAPVKVIDADFTAIEESTDSDAPPPTNVLAVADRPASIAVYEQQFGGKRLVEATLFYGPDGELLPPLPEIVIAEGSPIDQAYSDAGIEHRVTSGQSLIAKGYCNPFLLKLATPAESDLVRDLKAKLAAGVKPPTPGAQARGRRPRNDDGTLPRSTATPTAPPGRASARFDAEGLGRGTVPPGGFKVRR